jgi:Ser/Thr protein kinase RdoA (MazF antagonist)
MSKPVVQSFAWGEKETQLFLDLQPEKILQTVELLGKRSTGRVTALNSLENRVFEVELEEPQENTPSKVVAKFYRPGRWTREQILEEHQYLLDLKEQDIPVVSPIMFPSGTTLEKVEGVDIFCAIFPKQMGRNPQELIGEDLLRLGRLIARIHNVGALRKAPNRIVLNPEVYGITNLEFLIDSDSLSYAVVDRYEELVYELCDLVEPLFNKVTNQRIHGDCHFGNILWGDEGPFLVDFDDMVQGPCVQDLWLICPGRDEKSKEDLDLLIAGYEELREFDRSQLLLIEPLRALRFIHFSAWIQKRWSDATFEKSFPHFGSEKYWREELNDLEEQLEIIKSF